MNITRLPQNHLTVPSRPRLTGLTQQPPNQDQVEIRNQPPTPPPAGKGKQVMATAAGALIGAAAGLGGAAGLAAAAGIGAAALTVALAGPVLKEGLESGMSGNPLHDITATLATVAAGAMLTATAAGAAAGLTLPVGLLAPAAAPFAGALVGAGAGYGLARVL